MIADEQTQRLPQDAAAARPLRALLRLCATSPTFAAIFTVHLEPRRRTLCAALRTCAGLDAAEIGNLVFTGVTDDPETIETLAELGFKRPGSSRPRPIRGWHFGRHAAMRVGACAGSPDRTRAGAVAGLCRARPIRMRRSPLSTSALGRMTAVVELLAILKVQCAVCANCSANILGGAPRLAEMVVQRPHVLDAAIDPTALPPSSSHELFDSAARRAIRQRHASTEDFLDSLRDFAQEESFLIGVRLLADLVTPDAARRRLFGTGREHRRATLAHVLKVFAPTMGACRAGAASFSASASSARAR